MLNEQIDGQSANGPSSTLFNSGQWRLEVNRFFAEVKEEIQTIVESLSSAERVAGPASVERPVDSPVHQPPPAPSVTAPVHESGDRIQQLKQRLARQLKQSERIPPTGSPDAS